MKMPYQYYQPNVNGFLVYIFCLILFTGGCTGDAPTVYDKDGTPVSFWDAKKENATFYDAKGNPIKDLDTHRKDYLGEQKTRREKRQFDALKSGAEKGDAQKQATLGECYYSGIGLPQGMVKDLPEAVKWFRKAAEQGNAQGQYYLGEAYLEGKGVSKDKTEAVRWLHKAEIQEGSYATKATDLLDKIEGKNRWRGENK